MKKPIKPKKILMCQKYKTFDFHYGSKKVSLLHFLEWAYKSIPKNANDVTLELIEDICGDDVGNISYFSTSLELAWKESVDNPKYELQMKKYKNKLEAWKKAQ